MAKYRLSQWNTRCSWLSPQLPSLSRKRLSSNGHVFSVEHAPLVLVRHPVSILEPLFHFLAGRKEFLLHLLRKIFFALLAWWTTVVSRLSVPELIICSVSPKFYRRQLLVDWWQLDQRKVPPLGPLVLNPLVVDALGRTTGCVRGCSGSEAVRDVHRRNNLRIWSSHQSRMDVSSSLGWIEQLSWLLAVDVLAAIDCSLLLCNLVVQDGLEIIARLLVVILSQAVLLFLLVAPKLVDKLVPCRAHWRWLKPNAPIERMLRRRPLCQNLRRVLLR